MTLCSQIVFLKDVPAGANVGYDSTWTASAGTRIATLPLGYNDGVSWRLAIVERSSCVEQRAPVIGRVSMDYTTIDVGHIRDVKVGDQAVLFGSAGTQISPWKRSQERQAPSPTRSPARLGSEFHESTLAVRIWSYPANPPRSEHAHPWMPALKPHTPSR